MKIILANYRYYVSGGPEIYMFNVKKLLEEAGHTVIPYSVRCDLNEPTEYASYFPHGKSGSGDAYFSNVKKTPKNVMRLLSCSFYNKEAYKNLRQLIRVEKPDAVYVLQQINALSPSVFKAAHDEGVRVVHRLSDFNMMCPRSDFLCEGEVCTSCIHGDYSKASTQRCCHGSRATTEVRIASMKHHARKHFFDCIDAFVCPTAFTASLLEESGVAAEKISVIPTFVEADLYASAADIGYVLNLGRISSEKGIERLIEAVAGRPELRLKVTGKTEDDYARSLVEKVEARDLADRVKFTGFVTGTDKERLIDGASCVACPSTWYENMPNAVLEAYAHGKPVVAFDIGCMPELVRDGERGLVVPLGDADALGEALDRICSDATYAAELGAAAKQAVLTEFSPERHLVRLESVLKGCL